MFHNHRAAAIDLRDPPQNLTEEVVTEGDEPFVIHPGEFALGRTQEHVEIPDDIVARIEGKSSLGRLGLIVHATAGFVDPGFKGTLTLEITNLTRVPIKLYAGLPIAQLSFMTLDAPAERPYGSPELGSHYQGRRPRPSPATAARCGSLPPMLQALVTLAASRPPRRSRTKTLFYILGGLLAVWAVVDLVRRPAQRRLPSTPRARAGVDGHHHRARVLAAWRARSSPPERLRAPCRLP